MKLGANFRMLIRRVLSSKVLLNTVTYCVRYRPSNVDTVVSAIDKVPQMPELKREWESHGVT